VDCLKIPNRWPQGTRMAPVLRTGCIPSQWAWETDMH